MQEKQKSQGKKPWPSINITTGNLFASLGFLTAFFGFIFLVDPALRPDPRENQIASLSVAAFDRGITFRGYARRVGPTATPLVKEAKDRACLPGNVIYLDEHLQGFKHRDVTLKYLTMNAMNNQRVRVGKQDLAISGGTAAKETGEVTSDEGVSMQWVQWPRLPGKYVVRFEVFSGGNLLAMADTDSFTVTHPKSAALTNTCIEEKLLNMPSEGPGFVEASFGGGGGFDWGQAMLYAGLVLLAALGGAALLHGIMRFRHRGQA